MKNILLAVFAFATIVSCTTMNTSKVGKAQPNINNTSWTLADNVKGAKPTLVIEAAKVTGNGGCNNYFGNLSIDPTAGNFKTSEVGSTRKMCENMGVETNFMKMLSEADKYVVNGNTLELYKGNLLLLKFNKL
ncbi:MAG: META domain-containing protein [Kaistella sp.]